jgi:hypothetical protein
MKNEFYVGQTLIATDPCRLDEDDIFEDSLIVGKEYKIVGFTNYHIVIINEMQNHYALLFDEVFDYFKLEEQPRNKGTIEPLRTATSFWIVWVDGSHVNHFKQHTTYEEAFAECQRLSKKENKTAYVLKAETQVEQISNVIQLT